MLIDEASTDKDLKTKKRMKRSMVSFERREANRGGNETKRNESGKKLDSH